MLLTVNMSGIREAAERIDGLAGRLDNLSTPLAKLGLHHQRKAARILRSGERGIQARNPAGLAASLTFAQPDRNSLAVGSHLAYAASQQFGPEGGYYRPTQHTYLAIPVLDNIGARGNARFQSPRDVSDGFFFKSVNNKLFFGRQLKKAKKARDRKGKAVWGSTIASPSGDDQLEVLFLLVRQAKGTAHRYATHDPEDQQTWELFAQGWVLRGR